MSASGYLLTFYRIDGSDKGVTCVCAYYSYSSIFQDINSFINLPQVAVDILNMNQIYSFLPLYMEKCEGDECEV